MHNEVVLFVFGCIELGRGEKIPTFNGELFSRVT